MLNVSPLFFSHLSIRFGGAIIIPILQMKWPGHKKPDKDYTANMGQAGILTLGLLFLSTEIYCLATRHQVHKGMDHIWLHPFGIQECLAHTIFQYTVFLNKLMDEWINKQNSSIKLKNVRNLHYIK